MTPRQTGLRILYHHRTQGRGAESVHIGSVVRALEEMGHELTILGPPGVDTMATEGEPPVDKSALHTRGLGAVWKWISRHLPGVFFELFEIAYNLLAWWRLRKVIRRDRYDLIYERYAFFLVAGAWLAQRHGVPFVLEANEVSGLEERARRQIFRRTCHVFERALFSRCTGILTVSSYLANLAGQAGAASSKVFVVPNAVDRELLEPRARRADLAARYGLTGRCVIGFAGWFDDWDRLDMLIRAIHRLKPEHPEIAALMIGDGPQIDTLRAHARDLGVEKDVVLTGAVPRAEVHDHMALADIAVLPHANRYQSPMVMFEFMARRRPIVGPRVAGVEDVLVDGESALMFAPGDERAFVGAIEKLLVDRDLRERLAEVAYSALCDTHLWSHNAGKILHAAGFSTAC